MSELHGLPANLPASFLAKIARDPAGLVKGMPPQMGKEVLPHIFSVAGRIGTVSSTYPWYDEALRDSRQNAQIMRTETGIMECLEARQRGTCLLQWHVEPRDTKDEAAKDLATKVTTILDETWSFMELRRNLLEALWYGRHLTSHRYGTDPINGYWRQYIKHWTPRHGDKIVFRYDDGTGRYSYDQIGLRISMAWQWQTDGTDFRGEQRHKVETTSQFGRVFWLDEFDRKNTALHRHMIEDGEYYDTRDMGRVHGVGIRDRIYWTWYMMQETLSNAMDFIERNSHGIEIWRFPAGNPEAEKRTIDAAQNRSNKAVLLVPVQPGDMADLQTVEVIEPGFAGLDALMGLITSYFAHKIKRYILGQVLTSEAASTGLGSGVADAHMATYADIVRYDAMKLQETITSDIVRQVQLFNFPSSRHIKLLFKLDTEADDMASKMQAWTAAFGMGAKIPALDLLGLIGARMPDEDEEVLQNVALDREVQLAQLGQQMQAQQQQQQMQSQAMAQQNDPAIQRGANGNPQPGQPGGQRLPSTTTTFGPQQGTNDGGSKSKHSVTAADIEFAAKSAHPDPSDPQREVGNYRLGHVRIHGLEISIETPKGHRRKPQWPVMGAHYGYIRRTTDKDGDHMDVFVGDHPESEVLFIIDQHKGPLSRRFDEHKVMLGFRNENEAVRAYRSSYDDNWKVGPVTSLTIDQFKAWLAEGDTQERIATQVSKFAARFDESLHPRKSDGKFAPKGGGESRKGASVKGGRVLPANIKPRHARKIAKIEAQRDKHLASTVAGHKRDMQEYWPHEFEGLDMDQRPEFEAWMSSGDNPTPNEILARVKQAHKQYLREIRAQAEAKIAKVLSGYQSPPAKGQPKMAARGEQAVANGKPSLLLAAKAELQHQLKKGLIVSGAIGAATVIAQFLLDRSPTVQSNKQRGGAMHMGEETVRAVDDFFDGLEDNEQAQLHIPLAIWSRQLSGAHYPLEQVQSVLKDTYMAYLEVKFGRKNVKWVGEDRDGNMRFQVRKVGDKVLHPSASMPDPLRPGVKQASRMAIGGPA
jgi:hypothetical protein